MDKPLQNIQDAFLNHVRKERLTVTILLMGGATLSGRIKSFDKYALVLENNNQEFLIFKHAIASIAPPRPASSATRAAEA
jgi:host factor-I protein